jgi:hypothetical protein
LRTAHELVVAGIALRRIAHVRSSYWRRPSKSSMRRCSPSLPTVSHGLARPWRLRLAPASAPCSGRSTRLQPQARCSHLVVDERVVG